MRPAFRRRSGPLVIPVQDASNAGWSGTRCRRHARFRVIAAGAAAGALGIFCDAGNAPDLYRSSLESEAALHFLQAACRLSQSTREPQFSCTGESNRLCPRDLRLDWRLQLPCCACKRFVSVI